MKKSGVTWPYVLAVFKQMSFINTNQANKSETKTFLSISGGQGRDHDRHESGGDEDGGEGSGKTIKNIHQLFH